MEAAFTHGRVLIPGRRNSMLLHQIDAECHCLNPFFRRCRAPRAVFTQEAAAVHLDVVTPAGLDAVQVTLAEARDVLTVALRELLRVLLHRVPVPAVTQLGRWGQTGSHDVLDIVLRVARAVVPRRACRFTIL